MGQSGEVDSFEEFVLFKCRIAKCAIFCSASQTFLWVQHKKSFTQFFS